MITIEERITAVETRVGNLEGGHKRVSDSIEELGWKIDRNNELTENIAIVISSIKGFARVVEWVGKSFVLVGKYIIAPFVVVSILIHAIFNSGKIPPFWVEFVKNFFK